jgi:hypothetical protein
MIPGSDEFRLDEIDEKLAHERSQRTLLSLRMRAVDARIEALVAEYKMLCPHTLTEVTSTYSSGGYDYTGRTFYKIACKRCDTVLKTWDKSDGVYG